MEFRLASQTGLFNSRVQNRVEKGAAQNQRTIIQGWTTLIATD